MMVAIQQTSISQDARIDREGSRTGSNGQNRTDLGAAKRRRAESRCWAAALKTAPMGMGKEHSSLRLTPAALTNPR
jgi:hypothetical protein